MSLDRKVSLLLEMNAFTRKSLIHTVWHEIFAIFPAIHKNMFLQIKITANIFPQKFNPEWIFSNLNSLHKNTD